MKYKFGLILVLLLAPLMGCDGGGSGTDEARVKFFHASPDTPPIDAFADSMLIGGGIAYGTATGYLGMDEGGRTLRAIISGSGTELFNTSASLDDDTDYTVVVGNYLAGIEPIIIVDENGFPDLRNFRVRAVNTSSTVGPIDVYILREGISITGQSPTFANLTFAGVSAYEQIDTNEYAVWITQSGTQHVLGTLSSTRFDEGDVFTLMIIESPGGGVPVNVSVVKDRD